MQPNTALRRPVMAYVDGFVVPLPNGKEGEYRKMAETFARKAQAQGAIGTIEALGDGLEHGHTTDFFKAVKAEDNENVVFSFILWPSKDVRDAAWKKLMADPDMQPGTQPMPFDGKRMFWGGVKPLLHPLAKTGIPNWTESGWAVLSDGVRLSNSVRYAARGCSHGPRPSLSKVCTARPVPPTIETKQALRTIPSACLSCNWGSRLRVTRTLEKSDRRRRAN